MLRAKIRSFVPLSFAKVCATYYGFWGLVTGCIYLIELREAWYAPLGVWTLFYFAKIDFTLRPEDTLLSKAGDLFWLTTLYSLTGWLSGLVGAAIYNLCSKFLGLQIDASLEQEVGSQKTE
jgi:hypothetical protein